MDRHGSILGFARKGLGLLAGDRDAPRSFWHRQRRYFVGAARQGGYEARRARFDLGGGAALHRLVARVRQRRAACRYEPSAQANAHSGSRGRASGRRGEAAPSHAYRRGFAVAGRREPSRARPSRRTPAHVATAASGEFSPRVFAALGNQAELSAGAPRCPRRKQCRGDAVGDAGRVARPCAAQAGDHRDDRRHAIFHGRDGADAV